MMGAMSEVELPFAGDEARREAGLVIQEERFQRGFTAEQAAKKARVAYKTWLRVESGRPVRPMTWNGVDRLFALPPGTARQMHTVDELKEVLSRNYDEIIRDMGAPEPFELMVIFEPDVDEVLADGIVSAVLPSFLDAGGQVENQNHWGQRQLTHAISGHTKATYVVLSGEGGPEAVHEFGRRLSQQPKVLRTRITRHTDLLMGRLAAPTADIGGSSHTAVRADEARAETQLSLDRPAAASTPPRKLADRIADLDLTDLRRLRDMVDAAIVVHEAISDSQSFGPDAEDYAASLAAALEARKFAGKVQEEIRQLGPAEAAAEIDRIVRDADKTIEDLQREHPEFAGIGRWVFQRLDQSTVPPAALVEHLSSLYEPED